MKTTNNKCIFNNKVKVRNIIQSKYNYKDPKLYWKKLGYFFSKLYLFHLNNKQTN